MDEDTTKLTKGLARCDEVAWRAFHDQYHPHLQRLARARGAPESDLGEIIQGVYLRVLRHAKVIRDPHAFMAWLACLVRCEVIDHTRRIGRRNWLNERFQQWQESRRHDEPENPARDQLDDAMRTLDESERLWIRQYYIDGWSHQQIADHHQTSVKAVESKLARIRGRLRQSLETPATRTS
jgi:RNA polymerase sigma factor (sigma-70 family)